MAFNDFIALPACVGTASRLAALFTGGGAQRFSARIGGQIGRAGTGDTPVFDEGPPTNLMAPAWGPFNGVGGSTCADGRLGSAHPRDQRA